MLFRSGKGFGLPDRPDLTFPGQSTTKGPSSIDDNPDDAPPEGSKEKTPDTPAEKPADEKTAQPAPTESPKK